MCTQLNGPTLKSNDTSYPFHLKLKASLSLTLSRLDYYISRTSLLPHPKKKKKKKKTASLLEKFFIHSQVYTSKYILFDVAIKIVIESKI